jgi:hypothetical protein
MTSHFNGQQAVYLAIAIAVVVFAFIAIAWVGRTIRGELGPTTERQGAASRASTTDQIPPGMMKEAIARGMVQPAQLAAMTQAERAFLFASLKQKLAAPDAVTPGATLAADVTPATATTATTANVEQLRVWCPMCGTELRLPAFPPLFAGCVHCGMTSAVRREGDGRYTVSVSPSAKSS